MKRFLCLLLCLGVLLSLAACNQAKKQGGDKPTGDRAVHTVKVLNENGSPLSGVGVYIYEDSTKKELVWYDNTNDAGEMTFEDVQRETYVAVLADVPVGYAVEEYYALTGLSTEIRLTAGTMTGEEDIVYNLGDMVMDFSVTDTDGNVWSLNELLKTKDAVVLNFYYNDCVPCQMEFPHLQEAYLEYSDNVAVIAMNPVDDEAAVAAFKAERELVFPMAAVNPNWAKIMQIMAYPKTVVIDRFGNIVLMHTGSVETAQQFKDVFAAVSGEDYEQVIFQSLAEVPESAEEGSIENPAFMGATPKFELTIEGGKEHYIEFLKVNNLTMRIEDPDAYIIYNNKTYTPQNGVISLLVNCPDMNTPVLIGFGNGSTETKTFTVTMTAQPGSLDNPYPLKEGDNKVKVSAGNAQGVYYVWTAKENGSLKAWCISATAGVKYNCTLYNLNSYAQRSLSSDAQSGDDAQQYVEVLVNKGDKVQMIAAVLPDENWNYPGGNFIYMVEFVPGAGRDQDKVEKTAYTITVTDDKDQPIGNVNFSTVLKQEGKEDEIKTFASNAEGVAKIELPTGEYVVSFTVPDGYTSEITEITLNKEAPEYKLVLTEKVIVMEDYTVVVTDSKGAPVENVTVVIGSLFAVTDSEGKAVFNLEQGEYAAQLTVPEDFVQPADALAFPEGETTLNVTLEYIPGTVHNPIVIEELTYTTDPVDANSGRYYALYRRGGMILNLEGTNARLTIGEQVYTSDETGLELVLPEPVSMFDPVVLYIENTGTAAASFTLKLSYPVGHVMNPEVLETLGELTTTLAEGDMDGYYYSWTASEEGVVTFYVASATDAVEYDISLTNNTNSANRTLQSDGQGGLVSLNVYAGDTVTIQMIATDAKALELISVGSFTAQENTDDVKLVYSVIVKNENGEPMEGVAVTIGTSLLTTDANGLAFVQLVDGIYDVTVTVPENYKCDNAQFQLTGEQLQAEVVLTQLKKLDYTVNVVLNGAAYTGNVTVQFLQGTEVVFEQAAVSGSVTAQLTEGDYTVKLVLDDAQLGYDAASAKVSAAQTNLIVTLQQLVTETEYTVTVLNTGETAQSGVMVQILDGTKVVASGTTNASGQFTKKLTTGNYTVKLLFSGTSYYYNTQAAVLTGVAPKLTIRLAAEVDPAKVDTHWLINDQQMYILSEGTTHVQLGAGKPYAHTGSGYTDCLFVFVPEELGVYSIDVDYPGLEIRQYGPFVGNIMDQSSNYEDDSLHYEIKEKSQLGNVSVMFGVENKDGVTDVCITITRIGEPGFSMENLPVNTDWYSGFVPTKQTTPSGTAKYINIKSASGTYEVFYDETDKVYKVMVDGVAKTLYFNMGAVTTQNISLNMVVNGDGVAGGGPLRKYIKDSKGNIIAKEEYTDIVKQYIDAADTKLGVYALTKDLAYIIQNAKPGWWDVSSPDYVLTDCNPEYGWLFAACYF